MNLRFGKKLSIAVLAILIPWMIKAQEKPAPIELTLEKAIEIALSENPSVKIANIEIQKKEYAKKTTQASLYPQIDAIGQYTRTIKKQVMYMDGAFDINAMLMPMFMGMEQTFKGSVPGYIDGSLMANIIANTPPPAAGSDGITVGRDNNWTGGFNMSWPIVVPTLE